MGLDISVYRNVGPTTDPDDRFYANNDPEFAGRSAGLPEGPIKGELVFGFRAGSYSGYGEWRNQLAELAGYPAKRHIPGFKPAEDSYAAGAWATTQGPFWELIHFSDCEGTIGPVVSAKLAKDFADFQDRADEHGDDYFRKKYAEWRRAFETASDSGAVDFH